MTRLKLPSARTAAVSTFSEATERVTAPQVVQNERPVTFTVVSGGPYAGSMMIVGSRAAAAGPMPSTLAPTRIRSGAANNRIRSPLPRVRDEAT
jgi:hypothetical protein